MSGTQSLVIRDCQLGDVGTYKCQVTNLGGEAHTTARLTVEGNIVVVVVLLHDILVV